MRYIEIPTRASKKLEKPNTNSTKQQNLDGWMVWTVDRLVRLSIIS